MNPFYEPVTKMQVCCRSLMAGCYGSLQGEFRPLLAEVQDGLTALESLIALINHPDEALPHAFIHEVHNPMNIILGYCQIILDMLIINPVQRLYVQILYQTGLDLVLALDMAYRPHIIHSA